MGAVDFLGGTIHWSSTCSSVPPGCDQGHSLQIEVMIDLMKQPVMLLAQDQDEKSSRACPVPLFFLSFFFVYVYVRRVLLSLNGLLPYCLFAQAEVC